MHSRHPPISPINADVESKPFQRTIKRKFHRHTYTIRRPALSVKEVTRNPVAFVTDDGVEILRCKVLTDCDWGRGCSTGKSNCSMCSVKSQEQYKKRTMRRQKYKTKGFFKYQSD